ncbi:dihydropteroate synthase [Campylobacter sp. MIT 12-5580]|uniref:dihydropteroate synthase n=1 Tax=Campylobacter sp. MIT 12-5580 TaxID=2040651 RepID=UPI0010F67D12|nr:dihydropteroate synthase [Campylobacter sp. MIT 12-5580]TKX28962.1 dihydropteroate synthase [Campylobacter sp. MIT 12-5580]
MLCFHIDEKSDFHVLCKFIKPHKIGEKLMGAKSKLHFFFIQNLSTPAANILKQDALRVGAELVTQSEVILGKIRHSNALLIANEEQIAKLVAKEKMQDFKLKELAKFLEKKFIKPKTAKLMGVLNINEDSFNAQSRVSLNELEARLETLLELEPEFIDIGAVSSRPGSEYCGSEEEFKRIKPALDLIYQKGFYEKAIFSLDSFDYTCLKYALDRGFKLINDISGLKNLALAQLAREYKAYYCLMHIQNDPKTMQIKPHYENLLFEIASFFEEKLEFLKDLEADKIILDVGIGFGKTPEHNLLLIKHLSHFLQFEKPLLVGASRKSLINAYFKSEIKDRLAGSLSLHARAFENGASIIRTHDVYEHKQYFTLQNAINELGI